MNMRAVPKSNSKYYIVSDTHIADKTAIDYFGTRKEKDFIALLEIIIVGGATLIINGDFLELWKADFGHIKRIYAPLFRKLNEVRTIIYIVGNHDRDVLEKPELRIKIQLLLPKPEMEIVDSWQDLDILLFAEHGDVADSINSVFGIGRSITWVAGKIERCLGLISPALSRRFEPFAENLADSLTPTKTLVKRKVLHVLERILFWVDLYDLNEGIILGGHTHEGLEEGPVNDLLEHLLGHKKIKYLNTGSWVASGKEDPVLGRDHWRKKEKLKIDELQFIENQDTKTPLKEDLIVG